VAASTVRGLRTKGVVAAAREALHNVDLKPYGVATADSFRSRLDADTENVRLALPDGTQFWGVARKVLSIFLRGALYNTYLTAHFGLSDLDACYEIPLDSLSAAGIRDNTSERPLPRWVGVPGRDQIIVDRTKLEMSWEAWVHGKITGPLLALVEHAAPRNAILTWPNSD